MKWKPNAQTALLVALLFCMGGIYLKVAALASGVQRVIQENERPMQTASTTVTNTQGISIEVVTVRLEGEGTDDWLARHTEAVQAAQNT